MQSQGLVSQKESLTSVGALFEAEEAKQEQEISELKSEIETLHGQLEKPEVTVELKVDEPSRVPANAAVEPKRSPEKAETSMSLLEKLDAQKAKAAVNKDIQYSVYVRKIYDIDVVKKTWEADLVFTLSWYDEASKAAGSPDTATTFDLEEARKGMWLPDVEITNRHMKNVETVSASVKVWPHRGWVSKVERVSVQMLNDFDTSAYPFDNQTLRVVLSSTKYMSDEVSLRPHENPSQFGVKEDFLKGTGFLSDEGSEQPLFTYEAINETDGELRKCRGTFNLKVKRSSMAISRTIFEPTLTLVALPYAVLFFPRALPFSMPRVATSLVPLLCMITFATKYKMPDSWLDVYFEMITLMIASMFVWSLVLEVVQHSYKNEELTYRMVWEMKILYPVTTLLCFFFVLCFTSGDYNDIATFAVRLILVIEHACILIFARKRAEPQAKAAEGGDGDLKDAADASKDKPADADTK